MKRFAAVVAVTGVIAAAMAATTIIGAFGQGRATNAAGMRSEFHFDARKANRDGQIRVGGFARFIAFGGTQVAPQSWGIYMPEVRGLGKSGNVCQFGGPAQMQVRNGAHYHLIRGHAVFNVADRRNATSTTEHDRISVRFTDLQNRTWDYSGLVQQGDIVVFERIEE